jgi:phage gp16-like protein
VTAAARHQVSADRRAMLAKIHLGAKELGLDDDARRDILERITGHRSSADCTDAQLDQVLAHFRSLGWKPQQSGARARTGTAPNPKRTPATSPVALKARAMWLSLFNLGVVRSSSEASLEAFGKRQLGVDRLQWADQAQGYRLIEALKAMAERAGWSQDLAAIRPDRQLWSLKARLVQRQRELLGEPPLTIAGLDEAALDRIAKEQGVLLRAHLALAAKDG